MEQGADVAAVILIVETMVLAIIPLVVLLWATGRMAQLLPQVRRWMRVAYRWTLTAGAIISQVTNVLLKPILFLSGLEAGVREGAAVWRRRDTEE